MKNKKTKPERTHYQIPCRIEDHTRLKAIADKEQRDMSRQLKIIIDEWLDTQRLDRETLEPRNEPVAAVV